MEKPITNQGGNGSQISTSKRSPFGKHPGDFPPGFEKFISSLSPIQYKIFFDLRDRVIWTECGQSDHEDCDDPVHGMCELLDALVIDLAKDRS